MGKRTLESHGAFFRPYLSDSLDVLDLGCGPGTISVGFAGNTSGRVVGIDFGESQIEKARQHALDAGFANLEFHIGSCYELHRIEAYIAERDLNPKRYVWRAEGAEILAKIKRAREKLDQAV